MSNGDPPPVSGSPYIIICSGRSGDGLAKNQDERVMSASVCAARFASFMGITYGTSGDFMADLQPITRIQHALMNHAIGKHTLSHNEIDAMLNPETGSLWAAMSALEGEYSSE